MVKWQLVTANPCRINNRIASELKLDGVKSQHPFDCDGERLFNIADKDKYLLSEEEQAQLIEYTPPEIPNV